MIGYDVTRTAQLANGVVTVDERLDATGHDILAADVPGEQDQFTIAKAHAPRVVAPKTAMRRWELSGGDPAGATQISAINDTFGKAIANDPTEATGLISRASFRSGIGDRRGARDDLTRALAIAPSVDRYLERAPLAYELNDVPAAIADAEAARKLDPSSGDAIGRIAWLKAESGDLKGGLELIDARIALGGDTKRGYLEDKAQLMGEFGDPVEAVKLYDTMIADRPGSPKLLNSRCWVKATRNVMIDTALKDCTSAIEMSSDSFAALDSRAAVWYRLGRFEDAMRDLDAVLADSPGVGASMFLRGVVLTRLNRLPEAARDLAAARRISPRVDFTYKRYGITP